jgi:hypothetical protein
VQRPGVPFLQCFAVSAGSNATVPLAPPWATPAIGRLGVAERRGRAETGFNGAVAQTAIWNRLLSQDEMDSIWTQAPGSQHKRRRSKALSNEGGFRTCPPEDDLMLPISSIPTHPRDRRAPHAVLHRIFGCAVEGEAGDYVRITTS